MRNKYCKHKYKYVRVAPFFISENINIKGVDCLKASRAFHALPSTKDEE